MLSRAFLGLGWFVSGVTIVVSLVVTKPRSRAELEVWCWEHPQ